MKNYWEDKYPLNTFKGETKKELVAFISILLSEYYLSEKKAIKTIKKIRETLPMNKLITASDKKSPISHCIVCNCITHTVGGRCAKCNANRDIQTVCSDCGNKYGEFKGGMIGMWKSTCDICHKVKSCASAPHDYSIYSNEDEKRIEKEFDRIFKSPKRVRDLVKKDNSFYIVSASKFKTEKKAKEFIATLKENRLLKKGTKIYRIEK